MWESMNKIYVAHYFDSQNETCEEYEFGEHRPYEEFAVQKMKLA